MKRLRVSVAALMALVVYVAVAVAALKSPTPAWAAAMTTLTFIFLAVATLGGVYAKGLERAFWGGSAIVGWGYMVLGFTPWVGPHLATSMIGDSLYRSLEFVPNGTGEKAWAEVFGRVREGTIQSVDTSRAGGKHYLLAFEDTGAVRGQFLSPAELKSIEPDRHRLLCHALVCPLLACLGGFVAQLFAAGRSRHDAGDGR